MDVNNLCLLFGPNVVKPPPCASTGQQTCESLTTTSMQQVTFLAQNGDYRSCQVLGLWQSESLFLPLYSKICLLFTYKNWSMILFLSLIF